jgi:hypothetical protein
LSETDLPTPWTDQSESLIAQAVPMRKGAPDERGLRKASGIRYQVRPQGAKFKERNGEIDEQVALEAFG